METIEEVKQKLQKRDETANELMRKFYEDGEEFTEEEALWGLEALLDTLSFARASLMFMESREREQPYE